MAHFILGLGIVFVLMLVAAMYYMNTRLVMLRAEAVELERPLGEERPEPQNMLSKEEVIAIRAAMVELALPWDQLFVALEGIDAPGVKLLSVEPNSRQGKLRITAEAARTNEIIEYVQALDTQPMLHEVYLQRQERKESGSFVFNIEALWTSGS